MGKVLEQALHLQQLVTPTRWRARGNLRAAPGFASREGDAVRPAIPLCLERVREDTCMDL